LISEGRGGSGERGRSTPKEIVSQAACFIKSKGRKNWKKGNDFRTRRIKR